MFVRNEAGSTRGCLEATGLYGRRGVVRPGGLARGRARQPLALSCGLHVRELQARSTVEPPTAWSYRYPTPLISDPGGNEVGVGAGGAQALRMRRGVELG
jgi:hypothetical protein